jgi:hypothetical protein
MVDVSVELLSLGSEDIDTVVVNVLKQHFDLLWFVVVVHLFDQRSQELDKVWVLIVDTEIQAVEQSKWVLFDVVRVLRDDFDDLHVHLLLLVFLVLAQSICFFKSVSHFMMKIDFLSELLQIVFLDLLVHDFFDVLLEIHYLKLLLKLIDDTILVQVISLIVAIFVIVHVWGNHVGIIIVYIILQC